MMTGFGSVPAIRLLISGGPRCRCRHARAAGLQATPLQTFPLMSSRPKAGFPCDCIDHLRLQHRKIAA